jgi:site-specific recombinase
MLEITIAINLAFVISFDTARAQVNILVSHMNYIYLLMSISTLKKKKTIADVHTFYLGFF